MTPSPSRFVHRFEPGRGGPALLLLHGTGGDETDLLPLGRAVAPEAALLSPRGQVLENGMPRFFRRLAEGVFDEADVRRRAADLATFVAEARTTYGLPAPIALGFSNGANIAAAILLLHPETFAGAVLLRPMVPLSDLRGVGDGSAPVLVLSGAGDPIAPPDEAERLVALLARHGAAVEHKTIAAGHGLSHADVAAARAWIAARADPAARALA